MRSAAALVALGCLVLSSPLSAQTVIYDGSQPLNYFTGSHLDDTLMLYNNPAEATRNGIVSSGADPNALEVGDAAWFRSTGRRMNNVNGIGLAGSAVGVDGDFMTATENPGPGGDATQGAGAGYVLYDANTTTGRQTLNISLYFNDPSPNIDDSENPGDINDGGNVAIRVYGLQAFNDNADPDDPWDDDRFTFLASTGASAGLIAAGNHRAEAGDPEDPVVNNLFTASSNAAHNPTAFLAPSTEWQNLSFEFDAGTGYDYLIFTVGGVGMGDLTTIQADRFGFDNISFEAAPELGLDGDYNDDGLVNAADYTVWRDNLGMSDAALNGNGTGDASGNVVQADYDLWKTNYGMTGEVTASLSTVAAPEPSAVLLGLTGAVGLAARRRQR